MKRSWLAPISTVAALLVLTVVASGATFSRSKITKQTGGSTGDSLTVAPDTSAAFQLSKKAGHIYIVSLADSNTTRAIQVSETSTGTFCTVIFDTLVTPSGSAATIPRARATADLAPYAGMWCKVILDNLSAAGKNLGATFVNWSTD